MKKNKVTSRIRVAIIEDDPLRVAGFHAILDPYADLEISAVSLSELANAYPTDVVVLQERHPGFAITIERARLVRSEVPIVVIAPAMSQELILDALRRGARGCIQENAALDDFARAIRIVHEGLVWAPRRVLAAFILAERLVRLRKDTASLTDLALDAGFSSHAHMAAVFNRLIGMPPGEYRKAHGLHQSFDRTSNS